MRSVLLGLALLLIQVTASADWKIEDQPDSTTGQITKVAISVNEQGYSLSVFRRADGTVWSTFTLPAHAADQIPPQTPPVYRIDQNEMFDLNNDLKGQALAGVVSYEWNPKSVTFLIWHGQDSEGRSQKLNQFMHGNSVTFRFVPFQGKAKETSFALSGADVAISSALGISIDVDRNLAGRQEAYKQVFAKAFKGCSQKSPGAEMGGCLSKLDACRKKTDATKDFSAFEHCLQD